MAAHSVSEKLKDIWARKLNLEPGQIETDSTFVGLGGFSILGMQLLEDVNKSFATAMPLDVFFSLPDFGSHVAHLSELAGGAEPGPPPEAGGAPGNALDSIYSGLAAPRSGISADRENQNEPFGLSDLQQAYWVGEMEFFEFRTPATSYEEYSAPVLDVERFERAINILIARQDALRAVFLPDGTQKVLAQVPRFRMEMRDLSDSHDEEAGRILLANRENQANFGRLDTWPLFRIFAFRVKAGYQIQVFGRLINIDGRSGEILTEELSRLYGNMDAVLPDIALPLRSIFLALDKWKESAEYRASLGYWRERAKTLPPAPELPTREIRKTGAAHSSFFKRFSGKLDPDEYSGLKRKCAGRSFTLNAFFLAAFAETLNLWSKTSHFTINILYSNRPPIDPCMEYVLGNFSSTLLLEVDFREPQTFAAKVAQVQGRMMQDLAHSQVSGTQVIREQQSLFGRGDAPTMPIVFASTLNFNAEDNRSFGFEKIGWKLKSSQIHTPQVWVDFQLFEKAGGFHYNWDTEQNIFPEGLIGDMFDAYHGLIRGLIRDDSLWESLACVSVPERQLALRDSVNSTRKIILPELLDAGFLRQAGSVPGNTALIGDQGRITYGRLLELARTHAGLLQSLGMKKNEIVAVAAPRSCEAIVGMLAVLYAGGAFLPIGGSVPRERAAYLLKQSGARFLLCAKSAAAGNAGLPARTVEIDLDAPFQADGKRREVLDSELAYIIYTSGSSGMPKGVMISHAAACNTIKDVQARFGITSRDRAIALSAFNFDLSIFDLFGTLAVGGTVVVPDEKSAQEPEHWLDLLQAHEVTVWNSVPAYMEMLVEHLKGKPSARPLSLRVVMLSGDWIPLHLPEKIRAIVPAGCRIYSLGGATEAAIWSNYFEVKHVPDHWKSIPYGFPLANQRFYVLDGQGRDCPEWVSGELYIAGEGLAEGYFNDPDRTRAAFIRNANNGERMYRTGDWGRYWPDGCLEFLGRNDDQVKIRGYRIELGEIEAAMAQHPDVIAAVAAVSEKSQADRSLVAWVVPAQADRLPDLTAFLEAKLPSHMIPSQIRAIGSIPLTPNGKVDRKALLSALAKDAGAGKSISPESPMEKKIYAIWRQILDAGEFGVEDDFFALGGHSILAVRMANSVQKQFGIKMPLSILFQKRNVKAFAAWMDRVSGEDEGWSSLVRLNKGGNPPLFAIHPVGGNVFCYQPLARLLEQERTLYALQSQGLNGGAARGTIEAMASAYLAEIRTVREKGPYDLLGWSMGGVIAWEMARQLEEGGEEARVILVDSWVSASPRTVLERAGMLAGFVEDLSGGTVRLGGFPGGDSGLFLRDALAKLIAADASFKELDLEKLEQYFEIYYANSRALVEYDVPSCRQSAVCLQAENETKGFKHLKRIAECEAWKSGEDNIRVTGIRGDHFSALSVPGASLLRDHVAAELGRFLAAPASANV
jgi:amino acid adenylation domain-containing protein